MKNFLKIVLNAHLWLVFAHKDASLCESILPSFVLDPRSGLSLPKGFLCVLW